MARIGGVGKDAREVEELRVKWIWNSWSGARESGRRARTASNAVHGKHREEKERRRVAEESEAGGELGKASWTTWRCSPTAEHAAMLLDGHARLWEASSPLLRTVPHREKIGLREWRMTGGVHV